MKDHDRQETKNKLKEMQIKHKEVRAYIEVIYPYFKLMILMAMLWTSGSVEHVIEIMGILK